jgi:hypothetical protein
MSRTIKEIYNEAVAERNRRLELAEFASDSNLFRRFFLIGIFLHYIHDNFSFH